MIHRLASFLMSILLGAAALNHLDGVKKIAVFIFSAAAVVIIFVSVVVALCVLVGASRYALRQLRTEDDLKLSRAISGLSNEHE